MDSVRRERRENLDGGGQNAVGKVRVPFRHTNVGMAKQHLDATDIHSAHREPAGKIMSEIMGGRVTLTGSSRRLSTSRATKAYRTWNAGKTPLGMLGGVVV